MITHVRGKLAEKNLTRAVVDVQGLGYELLIPLSTFDRLPREGEEVMLKTILHVREDLMQLYGFHTEAERKLFVLLTTTVSGIGPKIGLSVLSCMSVESFCAHIVNKNIKALSGISGVGKRTAERLVVELKGKIDAIAPAVALSGKVPGADGETPTAPTFGREAEDAVAGLVSLGIKPDTARKAIRDVIDDMDDEEISTQKLIRLALRGVAN